MTIKVGMGLTGRIYAGTVLKDRTWGKNKTDVTNDAICAVADHAIKFKKETGKDIFLSDENGKPVVKITVEELSND